MIVLAQKFPIHDLHDMQKVSILRKLIERVLCRTFSKLMTIKLFKVVGENYVCIASLVGIENVYY